MVAMVLHKGTAVPVGSCTLVGLLGLASATVVHSSLTASLTNEAIETSASPETAARLDR